VRRAVARMPDSGEPMNRMLIAAALAGAVSLPGAAPAAGDVTQEIVARERASFVAWQKKDRAFMEEYLADDATYFGPLSPYRYTEPKVNFLPRFEKIADAHKILDFSILNPMVQVYGDTAILTYNEEVTSEDDGKVATYTGKATTVYVREKGKWRAVHGHESLNPAK
jgi:ketosteroid isomerase-like protein